MTITDSGVTTTPSTAAINETALELTVRSVHRPTADSVHIVMDPPRPAPHHAPGQYLTILADLDGTALARSYSLTTVPGLDDTMAVVVKRTPGGRLSNFLNDHTRPGQRMTVLPPMGRFTLATDPGLRRHVVLLAAGSGITPIYAIARAVLHREPRSRVTLVYANVGLDDIIFRVELDALAHDHRGRLDISHVLERPAGMPDALAGQLDILRARTLIRAVVPDPATALYFVCGPAAFMDAAVAALAGLDVPDEHVKVERFTAAAAADDAAVHTVRLSGEQTAEMQVPATRTLLEAAEDVGVVIPYSCRVGDCGTCKTRLLRGTVSMSAVDGLTEDEEADGYVLTCVARPTSDVELVLR